MLSESSSVVVLLIHINKTSSNVHLLKWSYYHLFLPLFSPVLMTLKKVLLTSLKYYSNFNHSGDEFKQRWALIFKQSSKICVTIVHMEFELQLRRRIRVHGVSQRNSAVSLEHVFLMILLWKTKLDSGTEEEDISKLMTWRMSSLQPETVMLLG